MQLLATPRKSIRDLIVPRPAEADKQRLALASLSGQQLKAVDVRARLGGVGGYAKSYVPGSASAAPVSISINFSVVT